MIRGDNCLNSEHVDKKQVIGLLSCFYRNDKYIDCNKSVQYNLYVAILKALSPLIIKLKNAQIVK